MSAALLAIAITLIFVSDETAMIVAAGLAANAVVILLFPRLLGEAAQ